MMQQTQNPEEEELSLPNFSAIAPEDQVAPLPPRTPWWRRRGGIISIILVVLLILAGFLALFLIRGRNRPVIYEKQQVTQGNFSLTVSATGPVQSSLYNLVFTGTGKIAEIDVTVGQSVVKGQVLAKLDKTSLQDAVNQAQAGVLSAQASLNSAEANLSKAEEQSNANVQAAQTGLTNAQKGLATTQAQSQASITASQTTLSNDQTNLTNTQAQSQASIAAAQTALTNAQTTLSHTQSESAASVAAAQTALTNAQTALSHTQAIANAQVAQALLAKQQACNAPTPAPSVTPTTGPGTPSCATATASYNTAVAQANANVATAQAQVKTAQQALATAQAQASANNATSQSGVSTAQKSLSSAQVTATSNNAVAQARVSSDQVNLTLTMAQANSSNTTAQNAVNTAASSLSTAQANAATSTTSQQGMVNTAQSQLQTALVQLQTAQHNLANATLLAPHAGIVTAINGTVGGTPGVSAGSTATTTGAGGGTFIQIADTSTLQVQANVNESDTANLKVGELAQFTVSAYGNRIFTGTVSAISPFGQTVSNVVTFPVTIDVNMNNLRNATLLPGMTASVTVVVIQQPNVTLIPVNAINFARTATGTVNGIPPLITADQASSALSQARQMLRQLLIQDPSVQQDNPIPAYVIEQPDGQTSFITVPVVLGLTDDTYYVVLQGVSPGDIIVVGAQRG